MIRLMEQSNGRFSAVITNAEGEIVTTRKDWSAKSIERISNNYGWTEVKGLRKNIVAVSEVGKFNKRFLLFLKPMLSRSRKGGYVCLLTGSAANPHW